MRSRRSAARRTLVATLLAATLPLATRADEATPTILPQVDLAHGGGRETWPIAPGQVRRHRIALQPDDFVRATIEQQGADVAVRIVTPDGISAGVDFSEGPRGREPASIAATTSDVYAIEVEALSPGRGPGSYRLSFDAARPATSRDREWIAAERAIAAAGRAMGGRTADTRRNRPSTAELSIVRDSLQAALPIAQAQGEVCWEAEITSGLFMIRPWGEGAEDLEYARLLDLWDTCGDDARFVNDLLWAARWEQTRNRYQDAAAVFDFGLRRVRERGDDPYLELQMLVGLGMARGMLGDTRGSITLLEEALPLLRGLRIPAGEALTLESLGRAYYRRADFQRAADHVGQAARIRIGMHESEGAGHSLLFLGEIHQRLGDTEQALLDYEQAFEQLHEFGPAVRALAKASAAESLRQAGRRREAVERLRALLEEAKLAPHLIRDASWPYVTLAELYADEGEWSEARRAIDEALARIERGGDRYEKAKALELRGRIALATGLRVEAGADHRLALDLRRAIGDRVGEATSLHQLSRVARAEGDAGTARQRIEDARAAVKGVRAQITSPQMRATWLATVRRIEEDYVDQVLETDPSGVPASFDASEAAHARSLLDLVAEGRSGIAEGADADLLERERAVRQELADRLDRQMRASEGDASAVRAEVGDLLAEHERIRSELRVKHPRYAAFADPSPVRLAELQETLLDGDTTLVEYFIGREKGHAWVVTRDSVRAFELPGRARFDEPVGRMRNAFTARRSEDGPRALRQISELAWRPLESAVTGRRLIVVPDGPLHHVPFAALVDAKGRPLVDRFEVVNAPSASVVAFQRAALDQRPPAPLGVAVLADPVFDVGDERVRADGTGSPAPSSLVVSLTRSFGFRDGHLPRLPFTRREARAIMSVAPAATSRAFLDFGASLGAVRVSDLGSYRYLHFATHGLLNDSRPELSGIVLSLVDGQGRDQRGLLTAPDVLDLRLGADLVVLSSCRSALGREVDGEGLLGLTNAFMYAGAPRVLASLWPVNDLATAELMKRFYAGLFGPERLSPAAALRAAQRDLRRQPQWRSPFYWAGFQLQGDWR